MILASAVLAALIEALLAETAGWVVAAPLYIVLFAVFMAAKYRRSVRVFREAGFPRHQVPSAMPAKEGQASGPPRPST